MEPIFEYFDIIVNRLQNPVPKGEYGERHHIYPKSCGGSNDKFNIVKLTPEEHYRCHCLLPEIFKDEPEGYKKMVYAFVFMSKRFGKTSEKEYGTLKREFSKIHSKTLKGRRHTEEWKKNVSEKLKGVPKSPEMRKHLSEALKGHPTTARKGFHFSEESKAKMRAARIAYLERTKCQQS